MKPSGTASVPQRPRRSAVECTPPNVVASATSSQRVEERLRLLGARQREAHQRPERRIWRAATAWPEWPRAGVRRRPRPASAPATASAFALERSRRRSSVASERCAATPRTARRSRPRECASAAASSASPASRTDDRAEQHVRVPASVLVRAHHREVGAEVERALAERRGERVVDRQQRARRVRGGRHGGDVGRRRAPGWTASRATRASRPSAAPTIASVSVGDQPHLDAARLELLGGQASGRRDSRRRRPRARRRAQARQEHRGHRRHARGEHDASRRRRARRARASRRVQVGFASRP